VLYLKVTILKLVLPHIQTSIHVYQYNDLPSHYIV